MLILWKFNNHVLLDIGKGMIYIKDDKKCFLFIAGMLTSLSPFIKQIDKYELKNFLIIPQAKAIDMAFFKIDIQPCYYILVFSHF